MIRAVWVFLFSCLVMSSASLKPESVQAWDKYLAAAEMNVEKRAQPNATFLWVDDSKVYRDRVRNGQIVVSETYGGASKKASSALIHDWTGAAFIPGAHVEDVMSVLRNYGRYREYYSPNVIRSKTLEQNPLADRFSILMVNSSLIVKTAIETDCQATYHQLNDKRWYAVSTTTRIQEINDFGQAGEHRLPVGEGGGYLWRLATITRFEERDGGVFIEVQALALSRDVPVSLRFIVDPIVRRVSRNSLIESLTQTGRAVNELLAGDRQLVATNP